VNRDAHNQWSVTLVSVGTAATSQRWLSCDLFMHMHAVRLWMGVPCDDLAFIF